MIIGAIESCSKQEISGWIYSPHLNLTGERVLAFLDGSCVGSGEIGIFRQDLADARLGDGHFGYRFSLTLPIDGDTKAVIVTLRDCEAFLKQRDAFVGGGAHAPAHLICGVVPKDAQLEWLCSKGHVDPLYIPILRSLEAFGVALHTCEATTQDCSAHIEGILEAMEYGPVMLDYIDLDTGLDVREQLLAHADADKAGVFVLHSKARCNFLVRETSDVEYSVDPNGSDSVGASDFGLVSYFCDAQASLVIRRGTPFKVKPSMVAEVVRCYFPASMNGKASNGPKLVDVSPNFSLQG